MKRQIILIFSLVLVTLTSFAQNNRNSIDKQFYALSKESTDYQYYKAVPKDKLAQLQRSVRDSLTMLKDSITTIYSNISTTSEDIISLNKQIYQQNKVVDSLSNREKVIQADLDLALKTENGFEAFGATIEKHTFYIIVWSLLILWFLSLGIVFIYSRKAVNNSKDTIQRLEDSERELEDLKRSSLDREQKLRRQLHDEIKKNRQASNMS